MSQQIFITIVKAAAGPSLVYMSHLFVPVAQLIEHTVVLSTQGHGFNTHTDLTNLSSRCTVKCFE